jgi:uncharacterized protein (TIGR02145 family)
MMKKYFLTTLFFLLTITAFLTAQTPQRMSYQSVLRDAQNRLVTNRPVGVQISILQNSSTGPAVYVEQQTATTNAHGLVTVVIGTGHVIEGSLATIQWENGTYYIRTQIDLNGGSNYTYTNTNQVLTVPYAFHAKTAETLTVFPEETDPKFTDWGYNYHSLRYRPTHVSAFINDVPYLVTETDPKFVAWGYEYDSLRNAPTNVSDFTNDAGYVIPSTETDPKFVAWGYEYDSLQNKPTNVSEFTNDAGYLTEKPNLDSVLTVGNSAGKKRIKDLATPIDSNDAVTKIFLENFTSLRVGDCDTLFLGDSQSVIIPGISVLNGKSSFPTVITSPISYIRGSYATFGGNVTSDGNSTATVRGVCWSTSPNPTINDSLTNNGNGLGSFSSNIGGLTNNTTYYVRAYATNSVGTAYGQEESFTTDLFVNCGTVTDVEGNVYKTVVIGSQCWMRENLRTKKYADGTSIAQGDAAPSTTTAYYYYPGNEDNVPTYGLLYNWPAAMKNGNSSQLNPSGVQGVCPNGWHLPSEVECNQLMDYVESSKYSYCCDGVERFIAKSLASTSGWNYEDNLCWVGNDLPSNNATGLSMLPAGYFSGSHQDLGSSANLWSATVYRPNPDEKVWSLFLRSSDYEIYYDTGGSYSYTNIAEKNKALGFSVRCIRDL